MLRSPSAVRLNILRMKLIQRHATFRNSVRVHTTQPPVASTPPLPIRLAIVGSTVTLATPLFTVAGIVRVWQGVLPKSNLGRAVKALTAVVIGGGVVKLIVEYAWPLLRDHSNIVLPFAVSNGVACMLWQGVLEAGFGLEALASVSSAESIRRLFPVLSEVPYTRAVLHAAMNLPIGGALLGALTALTAPLLWPYAMDLLWEPNLKRFLLGGESALWLQDSYYSVIGIVGLPVGILSGIALHLVLRPAVLGIPSQPWTFSALPVLVICSVLCALFYNPALVLGRGASFKDLYWIIRSDPKAESADCEVFSVNVLTGQELPGPAAAIKSQTSRRTVTMFHSVRDPFMQARDCLTDLLSSSAPAPRHPEVEHNAVCSATGLATMKLDTDERGALLAGERIYTAEEVRSVQDMFGIIDLLVRRKYLSMMIARKGATGDLDEVGGADWGKWATAEMMRVSESAGREYGVGDIDAFHREIDMACVARGRWKRSQSSMSPGGGSHTAREGLRAADESLYMKARERMLAEHRLDETAVVDSAESRQRIAVHLLANNLDIYEKELQRKIDYVLVTGDFDEEEKLIAQYRSHKLWSLVRSAVQTSALIALPLSAIYLVIQAGSQK